MNKKAALAALLTAGLVIGVPAVASAASPADVKVKATLTGGSAGDPDGKGKFSATLDEDSLCYSLTAKRVGVTNGAHIHADDGSTVVTVHRTGGLVECLDVVPDAEDTELTLSESELAAIAADPSGFYVDVHSVRFPDGAISGSLK
jgi:hypothetical protein